MNIRYLLPCFCGERIPVEPRQAGEEIRCRCGASLEVPTMRKMAELAPAEPEPLTQRPSVSWGVRQGIALLGIVIVLGAMVPGILLLRSRPIRPILNVDPDAIRRESQQLAPIHAWRVWRSVRARGLDRRKLITDVAYHEAITRWWSAMTVVLVILVPGIILTVAPLLTKRRPISYAAHR